MEHWKFIDPPNVAVIANKKALTANGWIAYVIHDSDDGAWQFHSADAEVKESDASVVSLRSVVEIDPSINELADLPLGWHAWRDTKDLPWKRAPKQ
jgi:hypothetical protein